MTDRAFLKGEATRLTTTVSVTSQVLIYIPCYCCEKTFYSVIEAIPELPFTYEVLALDNASPDLTRQVIEEAQEKFRDKVKIHYFRVNKNVGYAGSQKLAYHFVGHSPGIDRVIMLHGDGQYPPACLNSFSRYTDSLADVVSGYRSKVVFPTEEETPFPTYCIIKTLNTIESLVTGIPCKEWHSGFVMYSASFLKEIPLFDMTTSYHFDAEMIYFSHLLRKKRHSVPIYKKYLKLTKFEGIKRYLYIFEVFKLMFKYLGGHHKKVLLANSPKLQQKDPCYEKVS